MVSIDIQRHFIPFAPDGYLHDGGIAGVNIVERTFDFRDMIEGCVHVMRNYEVVHIGDEPDEKTVAPASAG